MFPFIIPWKKSENLWVSDVFKGIEEAHWLEMG